jgi:hypothetical protein
VCTPVVDEETTKRSRPTPAMVEVANDCVATVLPLREVILPPAPPASVPQEKVPPDQRSFSVDGLQAESEAPKRVARVSPPVEEALPR